MKPKTILPPNFVSKMDPQDRLELGQKTSHEIAIATDLRLEKDLHNLIINELNRRQIFFIHSRTDKKTTQRPGIPDFILALWMDCAAHPVAIEVKIGSNKLSPDQEEVRSEMIQSGWKYHVVYSFDEFRSVLLEEHHE